MLGTEDRAYLGQFDLADTCQVVYYLLLFVFQLLLVRQNLPFTSTADAEMPASRLATDRGGVYDPQHAGFHERVFLFGHLQIHDVSRHAVGHKDDHPFSLRTWYIVPLHFVTWYFVTWYFVTWYFVTWYLGNGFSFCGYAGDLDML